MKKVSFSSKVQGDDRVPKPSQRAEESTASCRRDGAFLTLQREFGNRALCQLLQSMAAPGVRAGDQSARASEPLRKGEATGSSAGMMVQRKCACGGSVGSTGECEQCRKKRLQRKAINGTGSRESVPSIVHEVLRSSGQPLDANARAFFEPRFGRDLGHVRVHTDRQAARSAHALDASAYTVGRNVVFGAGKYAPLTRDGRHLLAHELIHVMQQAGGQPSSIGVAEPNSPAEREANASAQELTDNRSAHFRATVTTGTTIACYRPPPPPVRPPPRAPPALTRSPDVVPRTGPTQAPGTQPGPSSFDEGYEQLKAEGGWMAKALRELEWPVATLDRGGSPPHFITVLPERFGPYTEQTGGTFRVKYRPHRFHILDAIGYAVANAKTTDELNAVRERYIDAPKMSYGFIVPLDLDPGGKERLRVYIDALNRLVQSASKPAQPARARSDPDLAQAAG